VRCALGTATQGIEDPELDPGIQNLAAPSAKDELYDDLAGIVRHSRPFMFLPALECRFSGRSCRRDCTTMDSVLAQELCTTERCFARVVRFLPTLPHFG
jgi:hypothetical protein